jgi:hypothetical protein
MRELLRLQIADDEAARLAREDAERQAQTRGLSVEQFRRAVVLGQQSPAAYGTFLQQLGFTIDVQRLLLAEVAADIDEADAARRRRDQAERVLEASRLPLSTVHRAARLGILSPATYEARLRLEGYTDDDIAVELDLLVLEIADVQLQRASGAAIDPALANDELLLRQEAERRRAQLLDETAGRDLSLVQLEVALKSGARSVEDFYAGVVDLGYGADDAELLTMLAIERLDAGATP